MKNLNSEAHLLNDTMTKWQRMQTLISAHTVTKQADLSRQNTRIYVSRLLLENVFSFLLQYTGLMFTTLSAHPSPVWFASGTACAFIFMRGSTVLPGICMGSFFAYLFADVNFNLSVGFAAIYSAQAFLLLFFCHRFNIPTLIFYRISPFLRFLFCTAAVTAMMSAASVFICYSSLSDTANPLMLWLFWWLANLNGILIVSIAIITWDMFFPEVDSLKSLQKLPLYAAYGSIFFVSILCISTTSPMLISMLLLLTFLISTYYGWCGAIGAAFTTGLIFTLTAYLGTPITVIHLQLLLLIQITSSLFFGIMSQKGKDLNLCQPPEHR